jgi:hypothetical protein
MQGGGQKHRAQGGGAREIDVQTQEQQRQNRNDVLDQLDLLASTIAWAAEGERAVGGEDVHPSPTTAAPSCAAIMYP